MNKRGENGFFNFGLEFGTIVAKKFGFFSQLDKGWEEKACLICESATGMERAAEIFFRQCNLNNR